VETFARAALDAIGDLQWTAMDLMNWLLRQPLWRLGSGLLLAAGFLVAFSSLPEEHQGGARSIVLIAIGLAALVAMFGPAEWLAALG